MSRRELVVLGTASMVPTRTRNHNGYVLLWDDEAILFDPGEGTQRQMTFAGVSATDLTRIAITHLHGDHSLGLAGVSQRISGDGVRHTIGVTYPASGQRWVNHLLDASAHYRRGHLELQPVTTDGVLPPVPGRPEPGFTLRAERLDHTIEAVGYRLDEPDGRSLDPALLARHGLAGPVVGELQRAGRITTPGGRTVTLDDVSGPRPGQSFAFVMDTRLCDAVHRLADGVDLLVIESTFLDRDRGRAERWGHLTARQAATVADEAGVRSLVLTHFSQRYPDPTEFWREAREVFDGELTVAQDLDRVRVPTAVGPPDPDEPPRLYLAEPGLVAGFAGQSPRARRVARSLARWIASTSSSLVMVDRPSTSSRRATSSRCSLVAFASTPPAVSVVESSPPSSARSSDGPGSSFGSQWSPIFSCVCLSAANATRRARSSEPYCSLAAS